MVVLEKKRISLEKQKERFLKKEIHKKKLSKINIDYSSLKKGHI